MRKCLHCHKPLARKETERRAYFLERKYCDLTCSVADRPRVSAEKRAEQDIKDQEQPPETGGLTFTHREILHRAHMAAPQVPISILDAVIKDIEPMLAANVRHRLLGPIAAQIRAQRAS